MTVTSSEIRSAAVRGLIARAQRPPVRPGPGATADHPPAAPVAEQLTAPTAVTQPADQTAPPPGPSPIPRPNEPPAAPSAAPHSAGADARRHDPPSPTPRHTPSPTVSPPPQPPQPAATPLRVIRTRAAPTPVIPRAPKPANQPGRLSAATPALIRRDTPPTPPAIPAVTRAARRGIREPVAAQAPPVPIATARTEAPADVASPPAAVPPESPQPALRVPTTRPPDAPDVPPPVSIGEIHVHVTAPPEPAADPMALLAPYAGGLTARRAVSL